MSDDDDTKGKKGKEAKEAKEKGGKSNLIPAVVLALGLAAGGYFMGGSGSAAADAKAKPEAPVPGGIATMDPLSINLADGHFLKVGVAVEVAEGVDPAEFQKGEISKTKDLIIDRVAGLPMDQLTSPEGRKKIKEELVKAAKKIYPDEVLDLYFTDFVMQ